MDFWISDWISGFHSGFLDFTVDLWISQWISGFLDFTVDFWISVRISADGVRDFFRDGPLGLSRGGRIAQRNNLPRTATCDFPRIYDLVAGRNDGAVH